MVNPNNDCMLTRIVEKGGSKQRMGEERSWAIVHTHTHLTIHQDFIYLYNVKIEKINP